VSCSGEEDDGVEERDRVGRAGGDDPQPVLGAEDDQLLRIHHGAEVHGVEAVRAPFECGFADQALVGNSRYPHGCCHGGQVQAGGPGQVREARDIECAGLRRVQDVHGADPGVLGGEGGEELGCGDEFLLQQDGAVDHGLGCGAPAVVDRGVHGPDRGGVAYVSDDDPAARCQEVQGEGDLLREAGQLVDPVGDLLREDTVGVGLVTEQVPLPQGVVDIPHGEFRPLRRASLDPRGVRLHHITCQGSHRPAVTDDVVQQEHQHALVRVQPEQPGPDRYVGREVERVARRRVQGVREVALRDRPALPVECALLRWQDQLVRLAVDLGKDRAQGLMAFHHVPHSRSERLSVCLALQPQRQRHVVRG
jgi:hypothetical protein